MGPKLVFVTDFFGYFQLMMNGLLRKAHNPRPEFSKQDYIQTQVKFEKVN